MVEEIAAETAAVETGRAYIDGRGRDSVFAIPPLYDDSYYGFPIHEIREMTVMNMGNYAHGNQPMNDPSARRPHMRDADGRKTLR